MIDLSYHFARWFAVYCQTYFIDLSFSWVKQLIPCPFCLENFCTTTYDYYYSQMLNCEYILYLTNICCLITARMVACKVWCNWIAVFCCFLCLPYIFSLIAEIFLACMAIAGNDCTNILDIEEHFLHKNFINQYKHKISMLAYL